MPVYDSVLDLIGNTPIVRINHLDTGPCSLYIKMESQNPGGSIKDRIGLKMIEDAEQAGLISPGATLVEGTAGNTGLGLALVAAQKGYRLILVIPDKMSREKISNLRAMGAKVVLTRSDVAKGHPEYYQDLAQSVASKIDGAFFINQFDLWGVAFLANLVGRHCVGPRGRSAPACGGFQGRRHEIQARRARDSRGHRGQARQPARRTLGAEHEL